MPTPPSTTAVHEIVSLDAVALAAAIQAGDLSCREVMAAHLARIESANPAVNAIVSLRAPEVLLAEAELCDDELARGASRGPLHGFPHAVKDLAATRGLRTTWGSPLHRDHVPAHDALFVERLRAAGAIIIGKTNTPEFGLGSHTFNEVFGSTGNAFDPTLSAGGSSGGAAVALALRMVPLADGSDFAGSLRNPAGWNGVFGLRPSAGRVPALPEPEGYLSPQLVTDGPMARTVADLSLLLSVMSGADPRAPLSLAEPPLPAALLDGDVRGQRIGWFGDLDGALPMEAGILPLAEHAIDGLAAAGCVVEPVSLGFDEARLWRCWLIWRHALIGGSHHRTYADEGARKMLKPEMIFEIEGGLRLSVTDLAEAAATRTALRAAMLHLLETHDALALPSAQVFPFPREWRWPREIAGEKMDTYHRWMEVMTPGTLSGFPVICLPAGFGGTPARASGVQLIGRPNGERELLRLARAFEIESRPMERLPTLG